MGKTIYLPEGADFSPEHFSPRQFGAANPPPGRHDPRDHPKSNQENEYGDGLARGGKTKVRRFDTGGAMPGGNMPPAVQPAAMPGARPPIARQPVAGPQAVPAPLAAQAAKGAFALGTQAGAAQARRAEGRAPAVRAPQITAPAPGRVGLAKGGKLTARRRNALPEQSFALPGRRYPIEDASHARNALSRVSGNGTPAEKAEVRAAVHRKFPGIGKSKG